MDQREFIKRQAQEEVNQEVIDDLSVKPGERYELRRPIEMGTDNKKIIIDSITLTDDPIAEHVEQLDYAAGEVSGALRLLAAFSGHDYEVIKKMGAADLGELMPTVKYLLGNYKTLMSI